MTSAALAKKPTDAPMDVLLSWRRPSIDFDFDGKKASTLSELIELGGLFPLAKVMDRIPFAPNTLLRWSREGETTRFGRCFYRIPGEGKAVEVLVDLQKLSAATNEGAAEARKKS